MQVSLRQYAQTLIELQRESRGNAMLANNFLTWLARRGETKKFGKIIAEAERISRTQAGVTEATIVTAHPVDAGTRDVLQSKAEAVFTGKKVEVHFVVDPALIGGARFQSKEILYDASLATAVRKLKTRLSS